MGVSLFFHCLGGGDHKVDTVDDKQGSRVIVAGKAIDEKAAGDLERFADRDSKVERLDKVVADLLRRAIDLDSLFLSRFEQGGAWKHTPNPLRVGQSGRFRRF